MRITRVVLILCLGCVGSTAQALKIAGLPADAPLTLSASATTESLTIDVKMKPEWHLYAADVGGGRPVAVTVIKGSDLTPAGALVIPASKDKKLRGAFRLVLPVKQTGPGRAVTARFEFMACDPLLCLPPMSVTITGEAAKAPTRIKVLLVADQEDARSKRIVEFFAQHELATTVTTYAKVTAEACNAHDVVLADSKLFRQDAKGTRSLALRFPKTESPIVAVGFIGTELIEAHTIAMTSGYI